MIVYGIIVPYINTSLSILYNKQLEIIVLDYDELIEGYNYKHALVYKKDKWVQSNKKDDRFSTYNLRGVKIFDDFTECMKSRSGILLCDSLELAQAAKLLLIKKVLDNFEKEVQRLRTKINKNLQNLDSAILEIKENNPEIFI